MSDFWFLSFANSSLDGFIRSPLKRIRRQAEAMGVFGDRIRVWTENELDGGFREKMKEHLVPGSRGYGYWCWKPQVVLQLFSEMKDGDVLLYADAGCHLNPKGKKRLNEYFAMAKEHGIVAFQARTLDNPPRHFLLDGDWCKGDLLDFFDVRKDEVVTQTGQLGGTSFIVSKNKLTTRFFEEFRQVFYDHFPLCDDSASNSPNLCGFVENRHDQSVFSLLGKKNAVFSISACEYDPMERDGGWKRMADFPIWSKHDKGGVRSLFPSWFKRVVHYVTGGKV